MANLEYITGKLYKWHGMQIPDLRANVEVELGTGSKHDGNCNAEA